MTEYQRDALRLVAVIALLAAIFAIDLLVRPNPQVWLAYVLPLILAARTSRKRDLILTATAAVLLVIFAFVVFPSGTVDWLDLAGRFVGIAVLIAAAVMLRPRARQAARLATAEAELEIFSDHAPAAIAHVRREADGLRYRHVNRRYAELYGRDPADVIGRHPSEVLGEATFSAASLNIQKALAGNRLAFDLDLSLASGKIRPVKVTYTPDLDRSGQPVGFIAVIADRVAAPTVFPEAHETAAATVQPPEAAAVPAG